MTYIHSLVALGWIDELTNIIVLYILLSSNTRWESQTFHHDENSPGLYLGFSRFLDFLFSAFLDFLNKITLR